MHGNIGVVVIGRNEGQRLIQCLTAARAQCDNIVYVDSASSDGSAEAARQLGVVALSLAPDAPFTAARGRRVGFERLLQEFPACRYVQFLDGDCIMLGGWLNEACSFLGRRPEVAVVCGRRFEAFPDASFYNRLIDEEWNTPVGPASSCGGDALMRVEAVRSAGSFRADLLAGEEPELCNRLRACGWEIWRIDVPMTEHDARITRLGQWLRRARRGGFGYAQVWAATRKTSFPLYRRQIASALFWVAGFPVAVMIGAAALGSWWMLVLVPVAYALQIIRIASRRRSQSGLRYGLRAATLTMLSKLAEAIGIVSFWLGRVEDQAVTYRDPAGRFPTADEPA